MARVAAVLVVVVAAVVAAAEEGAGAAEEVSRSSSIAKLVLASAKLTFPPGCSLSLRSHRPLVTLELRSCAGGSIDDGRQAVKIRCGFYRCIDVQSSRLLHQRLAVD